MPLGQAMVSALSALRRSLPSKAALAILSALQYNHALDPESDKSRAPVAHGMSSADIGDSGLPRLGRRWMASRNQHKDGGPEMANFTAWVMAEMAAADECIGDLEREMNP
jgi:hypothetical protein